MALTFTGSIGITLSGSNATAATQKVNWFVIENARGSRKVINVRRLVCTNDSVQISTVLKPYARTYRVTDFDYAPGGGTLLRKNAFDTTQTSDSFVRLWANGSYNFTGIGSATTTNRAWSAIAGSHVYTLIGQINGGGIAERNWLPSYVGGLNNKFKIYPSEALVVCLENPALDPGDIPWFINCMWQEEDITTYTINGTITNGGSGVVGAKVTVMMADDANYTNASVWEIVTSTGGGAWTCNIPTGKWAYAHCHWNDTGTYYTSAGAPFLS